MRMLGRPACQRRPFDPDWLIKIINHHELAHHSHILMLQDVAVEHVGHVWIGVAGKAQDDAHGFRR